MMERPVSATEMASRQKYLDDLDKFLEKCQSDVTDMLDTLGWTPDHFIQPKKVATCCYNSGHTMPAASLKKHEQVCGLIQQGCSKEESEKILDNSDYFYEGAKCVYKVALDKETINSVLWNYHVKNHSAIMASRFQQVLHQTRQNIHALKEETKKQEHSLRNDLFNVLLVFALQRISVTRCLHQISLYYGHATMPLTPSQEEQMLSREDRLGLSEYVITKAREANRLAQLEKDELMASENLADLIRKDDAEDGKRQLTHIEELAAMIDFKRRRQSYRAKNVHITKKSHTEIMREVINNQMEMYSKQLQEEASTETSITERVTQMLDSVKEEIEDGEYQEPDQSEANRSTGSREPYKRPRDRSRERESGSRNYGKSQDRSRDRDHGSSTYKGSRDRERDFRHRAGSRDRDPSSNSYRESRDRERDFRDRAGSRERDPGSSSYREPRDRSREREFRHPDRYGDSRESERKNKDRSRSRSRSKTRERSKSHKKHKKKHKHKSSHRKRRDSSASDTDKDSTDKQ